MANLPQCARKQTQRLLPQIPPFSLRYWLARPHSLLHKGHLSPLCFLSVSYPFSQDWQFVHSILGMFLKSIALICGHGNILHSENTARSIVASR